MDVWYSRKDIRFKALAEDWQRIARPFAGLVFGHQLHGSIGQYIRDLDLIAKATAPINASAKGRSARVFASIAPTFDGRPPRS